MKHPFLQNLRIPVRRAADGVFLGVLRGFAEHFGWKLWLTRALGVLTLLLVPGIIEHHGSSSFYGAGFFYLLLALLMKPPLREGEVDLSDNPRRGSSSAESAAGSGDFPWRAGRRFVPMFRGGRRSLDPSETTTLPVGAGGRLDLQALDRQLDSLNRRIARMENIVTRREDDWESRLRRG